MRVRKSHLVLVLLVLATTPMLGEAQLTEGTEIAGVIDAHWHVGPPTFQSIDRSLDALDAARIAESHGMRAIVLKQHYFETASWAYLISRMVPGIQIFGGIALNRSVGGLNPVAVENLATFPNGVGRIVYMPTFESEHYNPGSPVAVPISAGEGELLPEVYEIFDIMARYDLSLSTGHSSPEEILTLISAAKEQGVDRIMVQHPLIGRIDMSAEMQKEAAQRGALLEYVLGEATGSDEEFEHWSEMIREVGPENVIISSDFGQRGRMIPTDGFRVVLPRLLESGFTEAEIDMMTKTNPARWIGLEPW
ncbi:MAG: hypothetical protein GEU90_10175 [Gemmatimonas sp.]|nr:hypothetical protein [Gemmatimonas sp.]